MKNLILHAALMSGGAAWLCAVPTGMRQIGRPQICFKAEDGSGGGFTADDIIALTKKLDEVTGQVKEFGKEYKTKSEAGDKITGDLKEKTDKAIAEQGELRKQIEDLAKMPDTINELKARTSELEQKMAGGHKHERTIEEMSPGEQFVANDKVKQFAAESSKARGRVRIDVKAITTASMTGAVVAPDRQPGVLIPPERRMTVRDLLTPGRTNSNAVQYVQETSFTNNAAVVSEGVTKPESTLVDQLVTANVATIAHWIRASKQILDDLPQLQSQIDGRLRYGLAYVEEAELLLGSGLGNHLSGLVTQATAYSAAFAPETPNRIDAIRLAILQSELALLPATGIVINPTDWARIELTKDNEGRYIFTNPQTVTSPTLWGRPVVATPAMTVTKFLTGAFKLGAQVFDREDANVEVSTEDNDNFVKNLVTIRAEERLALAIYRPQAFIYGTFQATT
jgi:HK97 family phage major capsid protein